MYILKQTISPIIITLKRSLNYIYQKLLLYFQKTNLKNQNLLGKIIKILFEKDLLLIKLGQLLSIRTDILPKSITVELKKLRENVKPFCEKKAKKIIEQHFKKNITEIFHKFYNTPIAAGSIAQIHKAKTKNNKYVIVKILRPNIKKKIHTIFKFLYTIEKIFFFLTNTKKLYQLINQLESTIYLEINFENELKNMKILHKNFRYENIIKIPKLYPKLSTNHIITMEYVKGISIDNIKKLKKHNFNIKKIAVKFIELFFTQTFRDNFFHADLHPGNIWIKKEKNQFKFIFLDFGIIGKMTKKDQHYMGENIMAFINKDYKKVAKLHIESGWVPETSIKNLENDIYLIFNPILDKPLHLISFKNLIKKLIYLIKKYKMNFQPQLLLFQKTLITVEGLSRELYPDINIAHIIKPIIQKWLVINK